MTKSRFKLAMERLITIDTETWKLSLNSTKELAFSYLVPPKDSTWKNDPLWFSWDYDDISNQDEWSYTFEGMTTKTSIFKIMPILIKELTKLIKQSKATFFYFTPTTDQRGKIYRHLINRILSELNGTWTYQAINNEKFYFYQIDAKEV
ncbi:MAG: hypothetical protein KAI79_13870 [Bacteroidales bacterium]|nr:hypothetical protein [Bacteroidales bacterium]